MEQEQQLKSKLPTIDTQVKILTVSTCCMETSQQRVKIKRDIIPPHSHEDHDPYPVDYWNVKTTDLQPILLYEIVCPNADGYLPSRVWWDDKREFVLMYYINEHITVRPFKDQRMFCFYIPEKEGTILSYDIRTKMVIDQIHGSENKMYYFFIFGELDWNLIIDDPLSSTRNTPSETPQPKVKEEAPAKTEREKEKQQVCQFYKGECGSEEYTLTNNNDEFGCA